MIVPIVIVVGLFLIISLTLGEAFARFFISALAGIAVSLGICFCLGFLFGAVPGGWITFGGIALVGFLFFMKSSE